jgi:hypothetical protein
MVVAKKDLETERRRFIEKGGSVSNDIEHKQRKQWTCISLRFPKEMLIEIDEMLKDRVGITRTGWILQTLQEKLEKTANR